MKIIEKLTIISVFAAIGLLSLWLQFGIIDDQPVISDTQVRHDPDYYIENFTATGMDEFGRKQYMVEAERMVHYPDDDTALLDNPHIVEYLPDAAPRHTYAESGWMSSDGNEILLTGNVRVIQGKGGQGAGGVMTTEKMRILLDKHRDNKTG
ncbi:MAG: LPS export ABC transporter periplasmic protein LptC [Gammaproteobacteria bacterium]|nr:LPS export ABC transporter periplasmic protein LptC [Gammaproteobacteria bacterium]